MNFAAGILVAVLPLYAFKTLGMTESEYGAAMSIGATAGLIGGYISHKLGRILGRLPTMVSALALLPVAYLVLCLPQHAELSPMWCLSLAEAIFALVILVFAIQNGTVVTLVTPANLLARTTSIRHVVMIGAFPLGAVAGGGISAALGVYPTVLSGMLLSCTPMMLLLRCRKTLTNALQTTDDS